MHAYNQFPRVAKLANGDRGYNNTSRWLQVYTPYSLWWWATILSAYIPQVRAAVALGILNTAKVI